MPRTQSGKNAVAVSLQSLTSVQSSAYRVDPYIAAAAALQALGKEKALQELRQLAREELKDHLRKGYGPRVCVLCRMLFTRRAGSTFMRPGLGAPILFGGTDASDWPLEPIELVNGVPFLITHGYLVGGESESPEAYLDYCTNSCDWSQVGFSPMSEAEKRKALDTLLSSKKWKSKLDSLDRNFLASQIK
jgi:hypothetical protein